MPVDISVPKPEFRFDFSHAGMVRLVTAVIAVLIVLLLEATRRLIGWALPLTAIVFLAWGSSSPRSSRCWLLDQLYMTTEGVFGSTARRLRRLCHDLRAVRLVHGADRHRPAVHGFRAVADRATAGGPGKVSVMSSSLFGTDLRQRRRQCDGGRADHHPADEAHRLPGAFRRGVEAVASTGGQIMPPIMGAAAFVMAEFLASAYMQVVVWALIPAILYYVACFAAVHFEAKRHPARRAADA
jgi:TRAP-type uncharacterized transport system fused permease subunit